MVEISAKVITPISLSILDDVAWLIPRESGFPVTLFLLNLGPVVGLLRSGIDFDCPWFLEIFETLVLYTFGLISGISSFVFLVFGLPPTD